MGKRTNKKSQPSAKDFADRGEGMAKEKSDILMFFTLWEARADLRLEKPSISPCLPGAGRTDDDLRPDGRHADLWASSFLAAHCCPTSAFRYKGS